MLRYLIMVTESLLTTGILVGLLYAYIPMICEKRGRNILWGGLILGAVAAIVMAIMKNTTSKVVTGLWNLRIFIAFVAALILFLVFSVLRKKLGKAGEIVLSVLGALMSGLLLFYSLPDVYAYPFNFSLNGDTMFSTAFLYRFIGYILGICLIVVLTVAVVKSARRTGSRTLLGLTIGALTINALQQITKIIQILISRRYIKSNHVLFSIVKFSSNHSNLFVFAILIFALVIPVLLWLRSFHVNEPYENPAQHRKIKAKWRGTRRWATCLAVCFLLASLNLTVVSAYANRAVELSPVEASEERDGKVMVPLEQVSDGHLHRFAYTTPDNITVRFIVIKKPNSSAFGVGLDACDICGETGYYERDDQIVCKLCDVVMNINTIGFKGGCNPIVIDYTVADGYIQVPFDTLIEHQNEFK